MAMTISASSSASSLGGPSRLAMVPPRTSSVAPAQYFDSFLELCPSIQSISALARSSQDDSVKLTRLSRALIHICSLGNVNLLAWFLEVREQGQRAMRGGGAAMQSSSAAEERLFSLVNLRAVREDEGGSGLVILAASAGHTGIVELLVEHGGEVDERDAAGWTPLMWAINLGNHPLVTFLLQQGADVEARSNNGRTCEDFIVSLAPLEDGTTSLDSTKQQPRTLELIADDVYEHIMAAVARREAMASTNQSGSSLRSAFSNWSPAPSAAFSPSGPLSRPSSLTLNGFAAPDATGRAQSPMQGRNRTLRHKASTWSMSSTSRRIVGRSERNDMQEAEIRAREVAEGRRRALLDMAVMLDVEYLHLFGHDTGVGGSEASSAQTSWAVRKGKARRREGARHPAKVKLAGLSPGCGALEVGEDPLSVEFDFSQILPDQMLVLGGNDVDPLLDLLILDSQPMRAPWASRAEPANAIFLCLRSAAKYQDEDVFMNLILGTLERIEDRIREEQASLTHLAYWLFNLTLLLHYLQRDTTLSSLPLMQDEHLHYFADLINESYVILIRDVERRLNRLIEPAMLDYESLPLFEDIRFEGEWGFMKTLTGSVKGAVANGTSSTTSPARNRLSQMFVKRDQAPGSPSPSTPSRLAQSSSIGHLSSFLPRSPKSQAKDLEELSTEASAADLLARPTPRTITSLLTSALHVLQLYEVNPAMIIQSFSQVFYWLTSEIFNRVLTNKRFLCRSKAMQLKLNVSALEDWARSNALPLSIVSTHLAPLNQLISWIAGQSSLREFDSLIATMQGLKCLNPLQMKRVVRDYRYEVGEGRMSDECLQYLDQLRTDWERRQVHSDDVEEERKVKRDLMAMKQELIRQNEGEPSHHQRSRTATQDNPSALTPSIDDTLQHSAFISDDLGDATQQTVMLPSNGLPAERGALDPNSPEAEALAAQRAIDSLFLPGRSMADYQPPLAPEPDKRVPIAQRDLLYSSAMLPFAMPSGMEALIVSPGDAFGFGRGHFTGTGTATLRTARAGGSTPSTATLTASQRSGHSTSLSSSSSVNGRSSFSISGSPTKPSSCLSNELLVPDEDSSLGLEDHLSDDGSVSIPSGASGLSAGTSRSVFTSGKGLAAGGYWQPVPIISEESLKRFDELMRNETRKWEMMRKKGRMRISSGPIASPLVEGGSSREWGARSASGAVRAPTMPNPQDGYPEATAVGQRLAAPGPSYANGDTSPRPSADEVREAGTAPRPYRGFAIKSASARVPVAEMQGLAVNGSA